jgi:2'-5' RNA ligase
MRLFAALPVTGDAQHELAELLGTLQAGGWPVRWVRADGLHLTVKFLGEVAASGLPALSAALRSTVTDSPAFGLTGTELGGFPGLSAPRVIWAGYEAATTLELLAHRVERHCAPLGFPGDGRPFRPHVTLGRVREGATLPDNAVRQLTGLALCAGWHADRLVLYDSATGAGGSRYTAIETFPLGT